MTDAAINPKASTPEFVDASTITRAAADASAGKCFIFSQAVTRVNRDAVGDVSAGHRKDQPAPFFSMQMMGMPQLRISSAANTEVQSSWPDMERAAGPSVSFPSPLPLGSLPSCFLLIPRHPFPLPLPWPLILSIVASPGPSLGWLWQD
jgi:hypothetical protein